MPSELLAGELQCQVNPLGGQGFKGFVVFQLLRHQGHQGLRDKLGGAFTLMHIRCRSDKLTRLCSDKLTHWDVVWRG